MPELRWSNYHNSTTTSGGPGLGPQGKAARPFVGGEVDHRAVARPRQWRSRPRSAQGCARHGELDRNGKGSPPARGCRSAHGWQRTWSVEPGELANKALRSSASAASHLGAKDQEFLRAAPREFGVRAMLASLRDTALLRWR